MTRSALLGVGSLLFVMGLGGLLAMPRVMGAPQNQVQLVLSSVIAGPFGLALLAAGVLRDRGSSAGRILVIVAAWFLGVILFMLLGVGLGRVNP